MVLLQGFLCIDSFEAFFQYIGAPFKLPFWKPIRKPHIVKCCWPEFCISGMLIEYHHSILADGSFSSVKLSKQRWVYDRESFSFKDQSFLSFKAVLRVPILFLRPCVRKMIQKCREIPLQNPVLKPNRTP